ncbi:tetratricopeptide repeat protein [Pseudodesulfovibrio cashew]|uniref:Tetratricopeptide repeat protein n=2 Tax=Pseudodesulfovibrio cashew TaxID=2678688 RepID=A0A6I6JPX0_9BACT|nr:tetratricopeptide repeat protein [Pseudodesulfovibrio cashew]
MIKTYRFPMLTLVVLLSLCSVSIAASQPASFEQWLKQYGAWDKLEKEYAAEQDKDTPEVILKRAEVYLNLNSPQKALELIEMTPAFADNATESQRLWYGGQAHRALGDLSKSVLWFSQAAEHISDSKDMQRRFESEPELETIWKDVWLKLYWAFGANHTMSRGAQKDALERINRIGLTVWGGQYWEKAGLTLGAGKTNAPTAKANTDEKGLPLQPFVSQQDREAIVKALALVSLEKFEQAHALAASISRPAVKFFWVSVIDFLATGQGPASLAPLAESNHLKALAFWQGNVLAPYSASRAGWLLGNPDSAPWTKFRNNILNMSVSDANKAIDNELGSMLISEQTAELLNNFKLALSLSNGDFIGSSTTWNKINKKHLPLALQLAGALLFKEDLNAILPDTASKAFAIYPVFTSLCGAAGEDRTSGDQADFWISAPKNSLKQLATLTYPMDKLLLLAHWQNAFSASPNRNLAKRAAYLFDDTSFGTSALLYLADQEVRAKRLQLGAFYLNKVKSDSLPIDQKTEWLDIKTRLELDSGRPAAALKTYGEMGALDTDIPVMTRLRMALLYQQNRNYEAAREQLLAMWKSRTGMTTALQAETLFWLGEGEQAMRNPDRALDYYLQLAWQYPQENIWALTAMYRASLIYEKRGKYETAKRLLGTVVKRADRKEQREAAQARIAAIDKKMGKETSKESTLVYPF